MIAPDPVPAIQSVTATSIMGWGGFLFGLSAFVILLWDRITGRGRSLATIDNKIDRLSEQMEEVEAISEVVDGLTRSVDTLVIEWQGRQGDNGYRSIIREHTRRLAVIDKRHDRIDAIREEDERRSGGQHRREMDRELDRLKRESEQ